MNERFINLCVEHGGESWLNSESKDLEELPESFTTLAVRDGRSALALSSTNQVQRDLLAFIRSRLLCSPWYCTMSEAAPVVFKCLRRFFRSLDLSRHQISEKLVIPLQIIFSINGFTRE